MDNYKIQKTSKRVKQWHIPLSHNQHCPLLDKCASARKSRWNNNFYHFSHLMINNHVSKQTQLHSYLYKSLKVQTVWLVAWFQYRHLHLFLLEATQINPVCEKTACAGCSSSRLYTSESGRVQWGAPYVVSTSSHLLNVISALEAPGGSTVMIQLFPPFFFSVNSSICLCLLSRISILLTSLRARSWALSSTISSKNLCLCRGWRVIHSETGTATTFYTKYIISNKMREDESLCSDDMII